MFKKNYILKPQKSSSIPCMLIMHSIPNVGLCFDINKILSMVVILIVNQNAALKMVN